VPCTQTIICRFAAWLEWKLLYKLAHDKDGCLRKGTVRGVYDGSLFYQLAAQRKKD
jgi:peroxygenase